MLKNRSGVDVPAIKTSKCGTIDGGEGLNAPPESLLATASNTECDMSYGSGAEERL